MFYPPCCYVLMTYSNIFTLLIRVCVCVSFRINALAGIFEWSMRFQLCRVEFTHTHTLCTCMYCCTKTKTNRICVWMHHFLFPFTFYFLLIINYKMHCNSSTCYVMLCFFSMCACMSVDCVEHVKRVLIQLMQCYFCCFLFVFHANNIVSLHRAVFL